MSVREYLKHCAVDFVLTALASVCLATVLMQGFIIDANLQFNLLLNIVIAAVLQVVLFAAAYRKKNIVICGLIYLLLCAVLIGICIVTSTGEELLADVEENYLIYALVTVIVNTAVFALSRTRPGFAVLIVCSVVLVGFIQFVYKANLVGYSVAFFAVLAILFIYRSYSESIRQADSLKKTNFGQAGLVSGISVLLSTGLALLVFFLVIAPLNPGHLTLKLFTIDRALETIEVNNPVRMIEIEDESLISQNVTDEITYGNNPVEMENGFTEAWAQSYMDSVIEWLGTQETIDYESEEEELQLQTLSLPSWWWIALIATLLLLGVLAVLLRMFLRRRKDGRIRRLSKQDQVTKLYNDMLGRLRKLGLGKAPGQTPLEFADVASARLAPFALNTGGVDWAYVSGTYSTVHYGETDPSDEELSYLWRFYERFNKNATFVTGRLKYCFKYFWIL